MLAPAPAPGPHYASYHEGLHTPARPERVRLRADTPPPQARLDSPPMFRWHDPEGGEGSVYSLILLFPSGVAFASFESAGLALPGGEWVMPPGYWAALPLGEPVRWRLRRIADRSRGEAAGAQPETELRTLVRVR
jgi:hypothetical protein